MAFNSKGHNSKQEAIYEVIVIGGGLMGSSAAWHLSNYGKKVLLLEKQDEIYDSGSSKGESRIVRGSNIENDKLWSYLHNCSVREIKKLIQFLNTQGISTAMEDIYTTSPVSYIAKSTKFGQLLKNLEEQGIRFEVASTPHEGKSKFGVRLRKGIFLQREYNEYSGTINPRRLIQSLHRAIVLKGNQIRYSTKVELVKKNEELYSISTIDSDGNSKMLNTKQVVCAAGPYTGPLLRNTAPYFEKLISPKRVFLAFFIINKEHYKKLTEKQKLQLNNGLPVIDRAIENQREEFYAMIEKYDLHGNPIIKVGGHYHRSNMTNPDEVWKTKLSTTEINWAVQKIVNYLNFLNIPVDKSQIEMVDEYSCIYSLTETEVPYVTPILSNDKSKDENFVVLAGMSGVGAKGAMAYGLIAANLLTDKKHEVEFFETAVAKLGYERLETKTL